MEHVRRRPRLSTLILAALAVGCANRPGFRHSIAPPARQFGVTQLNLPSGMQLLIEDSDLERTVASVLVVGAGAADEPSGKEGLAHLVEHLTFRAHGPGQPSVRQRIVDEGIGYFNAATSVDATHYDLLAAPERIGAIARIEAALLRGPLEGVDEATFAVERQVVINELLTRYGHERLPLAYDALLRQLYPPSDPYAHGVIGSVESLSRLTLEDARAFVRTWYRPDRLTWVIAGKVDRSRLLETLRAEIPPELTDAAPASPPPPASISPPEPPLGTGLPTFKGPWLERELLIAWTLPPAHGPFESLIASLPTVVASQVHVDEVESQTGWLRGMDQSSVLVVSLELKTGARAEQVLERFLSKLPGSWPNLWYQPGTRAYQAFSAFRFELLEDQVRTTEPLLARARLRALNAHRSHSPQTLAVLADSILAVQYPELVRLGQKYVTPERARAVLLEPAAPGEPGSEGEAGPESVHVTIPAPTIDHSAEQIRALARGPGLEIHSFRASSGLEVSVVPLGPRDVVNVVLAVPEGRATTARPGMAEVTTLAQHTRGVGRGIVVDRRWGRDIGLVKLQGGPSQLPELLEKLAGEVNIRINTLSDPASLRFSGETPGPRFDRRFWRALYGDSRMGTHSTEAEIRAVSIGEVNDWLHQAFDPTRSMLVVSGDVRGDVQAEVEKRLGDWRARSTAPRPRVTHPPVRWTRLHLLTDSRSDRSSVRLRFGCLMSGAGLGDRLAAELLAIEMKRRWWDVIREGRGASYIVSASVHERLDGRNRDLSVDLEVQESTLPEVVAEVERTWRGLPDSLVDATAVRRVQWDFARRYSVAYPTGLSVGLELAEERLRGRATGVLDDVPAALIAVTPAQLSTVARDCQASSLLGLQGQQAIVESPALVPDAERVTIDR